MNSRFYSRLSMESAFLLLFTALIPSVFAAPLNSINEQSIRSHHEEAPVIDRTGRPDSFGYIYMDSAEPNGPAFSWVTHTISASTISSTVWTPNSDNGYAGPFTLPFTFPFYGSAFSQLYLGTNGYITFNSGDTTRRKNHRVPDLPAGFHWIFQCYPGAADCYN